MVALTLGEAAPFFKKSFFAALFSQRLMFSPFIGSMLKTMVATSRQKLYHFAFVSSFFSLLRQCATSAIRAQAPPVQLAPTTLRQLGMRSVKYLHRNSTFSST